MLLNWMDQIVTVKQVILQGLFSNYLSRCFFHEVELSGETSFWAEAHYVTYGLSTTKHGSLFFEGLDVPVTSRKAHSASIAQRV